MPGVDDGPARSAGVVVAGGAEETPDEQPAVRSGLGDQAVGDDPVEDWGTVVGGYDDPEPAQLGEHLHGAHSATRWRL
jgi:hypothetical protein